MIHIIYERDGKRYTWLKGDQETVDSLLKWVESTGEVTIISRREVNHVDKDNRYPSEKRADQAELIIERNRVRNEFVKQLNEMADILAEASTHPNLIGTQEVVFLIPALRDQIVKALRAASTMINQLAR
jgi:hypothetical protein